MIRLNFFEKKMKRSYVLILIITLLFSFFASCSPTSSHDYQTQACALMDQFIKDLRKINDPQQLQKMQNKLKKNFNQLAQFMIEYRLYIEKHPELRVEPNERLSLTAFNLKCELYRIYQLDGALQIIEVAQKDAYNKLGLFEHSLTNERINLFESHKPLLKNS